MKRFFVALVGLLVLASAAAAESQMKPVIYAGGGISAPVSPEWFSDYWGLGYNFGGGVGLQINPSMEVTGNAFFNSHAFDDQKWVDYRGVPGVAIDGLDFQSIEFGFDFKYILMADRPDAKFLPFLVMGVGAANIKFTDATRTGGDDSYTLPASENSETKFEWSGGAGVNFMFSPKAGVWLDGRWVMVTTENESINYIPVRAGLRYLVGE
jgi:opacity protein-like surface antigen